MVDEGVVSFSVAASFLAAVPLCAIQGSWLAEWSFDLFFATWILASLAAYPFVCALLNAYFLAALPVDRERMAASGRMETATIVAGAVSYTHLVKTARFGNFGSIPSRPSAGVGTVCLTFYQMGQLLSVSYLFDMIAKPPCSLHAGTFSASWRAAEGRPCASPGHLRICGARPCTCPRRCYTPFEKLTSQSKNEG